MDELGALTGRLLRRILAAETPIFARHGLTMWQYVVISAVARHPRGIRQIDLARLIGYDKTRLIALLDDLESVGLVRRAVSEDDRRVRRVLPTRKGGTVHLAVHDEIEAMEAELLAGVADGDVRTFRDVLARIAAGQKTG